MKLVLLLVLVVLLWHWVCALPCPSCSNHHVQKPGEKEKPIIATVSGFAKNAATYIDQKFHDITSLEEEDEPWDSTTFIRLKKSTTLNKTKEVAAATNRLDFNSTKTIIDNEVANLTKTATENPLKNDTKQVPVARNDFDKNNTEVIIENPVKNATENIKEIDKNGTEFIENDVKNKTKCKKLVSVAQNLLEVDKNIIHHHHNPLKADNSTTGVRNLNELSGKTKRRKRSINELKESTNKTKHNIGKQAKGRHIARTSSTPDKEMDGRYLLIHDVPPYRRKRSSNEIDHLDSCDHQKAKNITIIIQNFLNDVEEDSPLMYPRAKNSMVSILKRTKRNSYFQQDEIINQPHERGFFESKAEEDEPKDFVGVTDESLKNDAKGHSDTARNNLEEKWKLHFENAYLRPLMKNKVLKRIKCTCVTTGEDLVSDTTKPLIENYFLNMLEPSAAVNQQTLCLMACEEQVHHHFQPKQPILCKPLPHLEAHVQTTNPMEVVSERSEIIMCEALADIANPSQHCMTYWLNVTFVEVALLMACCVVSLYGLCVILSKKKKSIPLYVATSATSK